LATQREIRKRIKSVSSTKKITKTMEMISTSKMKKMQIRLSKSKPYEKKLEQVICTLFDSGFTGENNVLLKTNKIITKKLILMITGNRGLCGGYNTSVINNTMSFRQKLLNEGSTDILFQLIGKKAINYFKFINSPVYKQQVNPEDKISFNDIQKLSSELIDFFKSGEVSEIYVSHTEVLSSATYKPVVYKLLPVSVEDLQKKINQADRKGLKHQYIIEPDPEKMLSSFLPLYVTTKLYLSLLESGFSEQNARRAAMKNATDAADEMVRNLTIKYNRARQAKITNEIAEIVGGASALQ
jgi:F-type H+-transporting ATPase subunit gamma